MTTLAYSPQTGLFRASIGLALGWNVFGCIQCIATLSADPAALMARGMSLSQAALYSGLPLWMHLAFVAAVFAGTAGCALLLLKRRAALPLLALSLAGYVALMAGDTLLGTFAAFGLPQIIIVGGSTLVAAGVLAAAAFTGRSNRLA